MCNCQSENRNKNRNCPAYHRRDRLDLHANSASSNILCHWQTAAVLSHLYSPGGSPIILGRGLMSLIASSFTCNRARLKHLQKALARNFF